MQEILNRIYKLRTQKGITQKEICKEIGISPSAFDNWKKGKNESLKKYLPQIATILNCTVEYLTTGTESPAEDFYRRYTQLPETVQQAIQLLMQTEYKN